MADEGKGIQTDGILYDIRTGDPTTPEEGQSWYDGQSGEDHLKFRRPLETVRLDEKITTMVATIPTRVPSSGTQYFFFNGVATSLVPLVASKVNGSALRKMSLTVDVSSPNVYQVQVVVNGSHVSTLTLSSGTTHEHDTYALALAEDDELQFRLVRTTGGGKSTFRSAVLEINIGE